MSQNVLSLEAPDTMNPCLLRVVDTSVYNPDVPAKCQLLQITLPGFSQPVNFDDSEIDLGFIRNFTACDLEVQTEACGTQFNNLPDGIYIIKWSVSPNEQVYVEYNHLRITRALIRYQTILCELDINTCAPDAELKKQMNQLTEIRQYLEAAKAKVEVCHEPAKGMELFKYALKLLDKFQCVSCVN